MPHATSDAKAQTPHERRSSQLTGVVLASPADRVSAVADRLANEARRLNAAVDDRAVFASAYECLTRELAAALRQPVGVSDAVWIADLSEVFAGYYLEALSLWDGGHRTPSPWGGLFAAHGSLGPTVLESLVLSMTVHIVHDLPLALEQVGLTTPSGASRIADYDWVNGVLGAAVGPVQQTVARRYDTSLILLDAAGLNYDEILTNYGLRLSRAAAWYNAQRLVHPPSRVQAYASLLRSTNRTVRYWLEPPILSLRFIVRVSRALAFLRRSWLATPPLALIQRNPPHVRC